MISQISPVTGAEWRRQIRYLQEHSHVPLSQPIKDGHLILERGVISSRGFLGNYHTIFTNLGGLHAKAIYQRELFRVAEVKEILHREDCDDLPSRERFDDLVEKIGNGSQQPNITIARPDAVILDGNKSAAAYHDLHLADYEIELSVYLVRSKAHGDCEPTASVSERLSFLTRRVDHIPPRRQPPSPLLALAHCSDSR